MQGRDEASKLTDQMSNLTGIKSNTFRATSLRRGSSHGHRDDDNDNEDATLPWARGSDSESEGRSARTNEREQVADVLHVDEEVDGTDHQTVN